MRFPASLVRSWQDIQRNFDYLSARGVSSLGKEVKLSELRTTGLVAMAAGISTIALNTAGMTTVNGFIIVFMQPSTHNTFIWYPRGGDIVFNNTGAAQNVTVSYYVIGT